MADRAVAPPVVSAAKRTLEVSLAARTVIDPHGARERHAPQPHASGKRGYADRWWCTCRDPRRNRFALSPVFENVAPAPVIEHVEPAPVIEHIAPVTISTPSQQFPPAYTMAAVTTGVSHGTTGFINPQFSLCCGGLCLTSRWFCSFQCWACATAHSWTNCTRAYASNPGGHWGKYSSWGAHRGHSCSCDCGRNFSFRARVCVARVQPSPLGTDRCRAREFRACAAAHRWTNCACTNTSNSGAENGRCQGDPSETFSWADCGANRGYSCSSDCGRDSGSDVVLTCRCPCSRTDRCRGGDPEHRPVCVGYTGFNTRWACQCEVLRVVDRQYEGQLRVFNANENLTISGLISGYLFNASGPVASAYVSIAAPAGGKSTIPRPYEVVQRQESGGAFQILGTGTRTPSTTSPEWWPRSHRQFLRFCGRDQIVNFSGKVTEIRSRPSRYNGRDQIETFVYTVSKIGPRPAGYNSCLQAAGRAVCTLRLGTSIRRMQNARQRWTFDEDPQWVRVLLHRRRRRRRLFLMSKKNVLPRFLIATQCVGDPDCPVRLVTPNGQCDGHWWRRFAHCAHLRKFCSASRHPRLVGRGPAGYPMKNLTEQEHPLPAAAEREFAWDCRENLCFMHIFTTPCSQRPAENDKEENPRVSDGNIIIGSTERVRFAEGYSCQVSQWEVSGFHGPCFFTSALKCDIATRIVMTMESTALAPSTPNFQMIAPPEWKHSVWIDVLPNGNINLSAPKCVTPAKFSIKKQRIRDSFFGRHEVWRRHSRRAVRQCRVVMWHDPFFKWFVSDEFQGSRFTREKVLDIITWAKRFFCPRV